MDDRFEIQRTVGGVPISLNMVAKKPEPSS
jgi:hypothetical protein